MTSQRFGLVAPVRCSTLGNPHTLGWLRGWPTHMKGIARVPLDLLPNETTQTTALTLTTLIPS